MKKLYELIISSIVVFLMSTVPVFGFKSTNAGMVVVKNNPVTIERNGKTIKVSGFGALLQGKDVVVTGKGGKALIKLANGDRVLVAQNSRLIIEAGDKKSGLSKLIMKISGKIRAQIQKTRRKNVEVVTPNAVIGVKGTDFVVLYQDGMTQVATVAGLVSLGSPATLQSVNIPPGKMSEVSPAGKVLTVREIAGEIMSGVEIAGEKMAPSDISGQRIRQ